MKAGLGGIAFALLGLWLLVFAIRSMRRYRASVAWPAVPGVIESSELVPFRATASSWTLLLRYAYELDGEACTGERLALYTIADRTELEALAKRFAVDETVEVYVEPAAGAGRRREAVLIPGPPSAKPWSGVILASVALVLGVAVSVGGFAGWLK
ncbi:MAG: DUF3592 domain-containing protein [Planctomycetota bacterium]